MDIKVEEFYKIESKELIDLLFDRNFLNPKMTRESISWLQEYVGFLFQSKCQLAAKTAILVAKMKDIP